MGYWNGWDNYENWYAVSHTKGKNCAHCGSEFWPKSPRQKFCSREASPACDDDRYFEGLWNKGKHPLQLEGWLNETEMKISQINEAIQSLDGNQDANEISDGYHTFGELYEIRCLLFVALIQSNKSKAWRALRNADGQKWDGWFIGGIYPEAGRQITFHLPEKFWEKLDGIETHDINPYFDGHTTQDVIQRLEDFLNSMLNWSGITINADYLFEFSSKQVWINNANAWFKGLEFSKAERTLCVDKNGNILSEGSDFAAADEQGLFPVKVYRIVRTSEIGKVKTSF